MVRGGGHAQIEGGGSQFLRERETKHPLKKNTCMCVRGKGLGGGVMINVWILLNKTLQSATKINTHLGERTVTEAKID